MEHAPLQIRIVAMEVVNIIIMKTAFYAQKIAVHVRHLLTPIVVMVHAIQVDGKTVHHVPMIADHAPMIHPVGMVHVIQIGVKIVAPVMMIVGNAPLQTRIVEMEHVTQKLVKPVVHVRQIVEHAKAPVIGMDIVNLTILKM